MIPSVILEGRLMLSDENNYFDKMFQDNVQANSGRNGENETPDDAGLCAGVQALLTLA